GGRASRDGLSECRTSRMRLQRLGRGWPAGGEGTKTRGVSAAEAILVDRGMARRLLLIYACCTACANVVNEALASPYSMPVFGLKNKGFSKPEKPFPLPRFSTTTEWALSTSRMGMPAIGLCGLSRASGLTTSLAPITIATSVVGNSGLICSSSYNDEYGTFASASKTFMCPG